SNRLVHRRAAKCGAWKSIDDVRISPVTSPQFHSEAIMHASSFALTLLLILSAPGGVPAQVSTGTIRIEVQDSSGAVVPGASLTLIHGATGQTRRGLTNERGEFQAFFVPIGTYSVTAELAGFKKKTVAGLELRVDQTAGITVVLEPGEM